MLGTSWKNLDKVNEKSHFTPSKQDFTFFRKSEKTQSRRSISDVGGLSLEEISCDEVDDILPKTDYTYARTASYSPKYLRKKRYISPNMSRRRIHGQQPSFISDDDDDDYDLDDDIVVMSRGREGHYDNQSHAPAFSGEDAEQYQRGRPRVRSYALTSTPMTDEHHEHHISTHDHYYDGMLLRSGSHVKGMEHYVDGVYVGDNEHDGLISQVALRSDVDADAEARKRNARNITTVTTTTTTVTTRGKGRNKQHFQAEDLSEKKLKLDESQTEKSQHKNQYRLDHLYGLDSDDDDISDVDDVDVDVGTSLITTGKAASHQTAQRTSFSSFFSTIFIFITTVVTTVTSTITESFSGNSSIIKSLATTISKPIVIPAKWTLYAIVSTCRWLVRKSSAILLLEIETKHRRRRGCCCWFLPLLLMLPLLMLGGYYLKNVQQEASTFLHTTQQSLASSWSSLWIVTESDSENLVAYQPPVQPPDPIPVPVPTTASQPQINMAEIHQYIQQVVIQASEANKDMRPVGLTKEQVEAIVSALLTTEMDNVREEVDNGLGSMKTFVEGDMAILEDKLAMLRSDLQGTAQSHQAMALSIEEAKALFQSTGNEQKTEWLAISEILERKLLDLQKRVEDLSAENSALTAMITKCCQNNSMLADIVRTHVYTVLSKMGSDDDEHNLAGLMAASLNSKYVDQAELDTRLSALSSEIMESMRGLLAKMEIEKSSSVQSSIVTGVDEMAVKSIIEEALIQFSADRVGMPDFALESAGGSVLSVRCSETYYRKTALVSIFGLPLWYTSNSPRTVIQPNVHPGECWAFKGSSGFVIIQLSHPIQPTGFTLEHIPRSLALKGNIDSAPRNFAVFGLVSESDTQGLNLGNYTYLDNGRPIQYFPVQNKHPGIFQLVELRIVDNHGNKKYTCIYRFRVHGLV